MSSGLKKGDYTPQALNKGRLGSALYQFIC